MNKAVKLSLFLVIICSIYFGVLMYGNYIEGEGGVARAAELTFDKIQDKVDKEFSKYIPDTSVDNLWNMQ